MANEAKNTPPVTDGSAAPAVTVESLQAELTAATEKSKQLESLTIKQDSTITQLRGELASANERATVLEEANAAYEGHLDDAQEVIADLKQQLAEKETQPGAVPTVKHRDKTYRVTQPDGFSYGGKIVTLADLKADAGLVAELVSIGAGVLEAL